MGWTGAGTDVRGGVETTKTKKKKKKKTKKKSKKSDDDFVEFDTALDERKFNRDARVHGRRTTTTTTAEYGTTLFTNVPQNVCPGQPDEEERA